LQLRISRLASHFIVLGIALAGALDWIFGGKPLAALAGGNHFFMEFWALAGASFDWIRLVTAG
jgi:hypothetical protein